MSINPTAQHDIASTIRLVSDMRNVVGIDIPAQITDEIAIHREIEKSREQVRRDREVAVGTLYSVPAADFDVAKEQVIEASVREQAVTGGVDNVLIQASAHRLRGRVFDIAHQWEAVVAERFNMAVEHFRLNEVASDLPNFADKHSFNVVNMSREQGHAVEQWREAAVHLDPLWFLYRRLVAARGDTIIGPADSTDLSTNLLTACILGDPGTQGNAESAATRFASVAGGADSVKAYGPLMPFVVPVLSGYELHLHTTLQANAIRQRLVTPVHA